MRSVHAHDALLDHPVAADEGSPGAAVTVALCGHWEHEPPCPLAPHHIATERAGDRLALRILFAVEPGREDEVRRRIAGALTAGTGPTRAGGTVRWQVVRHGPSAVTDAEAEHAAALARS